MKIEARVWYYFVYARLIPVMINSEVVRKQAFLTYVILANRNVDVSKVSNQEIHEMIAKRTWKESIGFPAIIFALCQKARVLYTSTSISSRPCIEDCLWLPQGRGNQRGLDKKNQRAGQSKKKKKSLEMMMKNPLKQDWSEWRNKLMTWAFKSKIVSKQPRKRSQPISKGVCMQWMKD